MLQLPPEVHTHRWLRLAVLVAVGLLLLTVLIRSAAFF